MSLLANGSTKRRVTTCAQCFVCHKTLQDIGVHFKDTHAEVEVPFHILNEWGYDQCADCGILVRPGALAMHISHLRRKNLPDNHKIRTPPRLGVLPATASTTQLMPIPTMTLGGTPGAAPGAPREPRAAAGAPEGATHSSTSARGPDSAPSTGAGRGRMPSRSPRDGPSTDAPAANAPPGDTAHATAPAGNAPPSNTADETGRPARPRRSRSPSARPRGPGGIPPAPGARQSSTGAGNRESGQTSGGAEDIPAGGHPPPPLPALTWEALVHANPEAAHDLLAELPWTPETHIWQLLRSQEARDAYTNLAGRLAQAYSNHKTDELMLLMLGLPKICIAPVHTKLAAAQVLQRVQAYPAIDIPPVPPPRAEHPSARHALNKEIAERVQKLIEAGRLSRAESVLESNGAQLQMTPEVMRKLEALHPDGPADPFGSAAGPISAKLSDKELLLTSVREMKADTAAGPSGWTAGLLKLVVRDDRFVGFLVDLANGMLAGNAAGRAFLCAARLIAFEKSNGEPRPIAIGEIFYRVITKTLLRQNQGPADFLPRQLGTGTPGGGEPIILRIEHAAFPERPAATAYNWTDQTAAIGGLDMEDYEGCPEAYTASDVPLHPSAVPFDVGSLMDIDCTNAYNLLDRRAIANAVKKHKPRLFKLFRWSYGEHSKLYVATPTGQAILQSRQGGRQGCCLAGMAMQLVMRDPLSLLNQDLGSFAEFWTLYDDIKVLIEENRGREVYNHIIEQWDTYFGGTGLVPNLAKTKLIEMAAIRATGAAVLGSYVGPVAGRRAFIDAKIAEVAATVEKLRWLDPHSAFLLLRYCVSQKLKHLLRSLDPTGLQASYARLDEQVYSFLDHLRNSGRPENDVDDVPEDVIAASRREQALARTLYTLPTRSGGTGFASHVLTVQAARTASVEASCALINAIAMNAARPSHGAVKTQRTRTRAATDSRLAWLLSAASPLTSEEKVVLVDNGNSIGSAWLSAIPTAQTPNLLLSSRDIAVGLNIRCLSLGSPNGHCPRCEERNITLLHDESCTQKGVHRTARHERTKTRLVRAAYEVPATVASAEPFAAPGARGARGGNLRADIRIIGNAAPNGSANDCDLTFKTLTQGAVTAQLRASPLVHAPPTSLETTKALIERVLDLAAVTKTRKYEGKTIHAFCPLVFSSAGTMHSTTAAWFASLKKQGVRMKYLRQDISVILLRARVAGFVFG